MGHDNGHPLLGGGGGLAGVVQYGRRPVGDQSPVLHGSRRKVWDCYQIWNKQTKNRWISDISILLRCTFVIEAWPNVLQKNLLTCSSGWSSGIWVQTTQAMNEALGHVAIPLRGSTVCISDNVLLHILNACTSIYCIKSYMHMQLFYYTTYVHVIIPLHYACTCHYSITLCMYM